MALLYRSNKILGRKRIEEQMDQSRIIIVGGGFGGLNVAKALRKARAENYPDRSHEPPLVSATTLSSSDVGSGS